MTNDMEAQRRRSHAKFADRGCQRFGTDGARVARKKGQGVGSELSAAALAAGRGRRRQLDSQPIEYRRAGGVRWEARAPHRGRARRFHNAEPARGHASQEWQITVDILKVPHHGSIRNAAAELFKSIVADRDVFSADGRYGDRDPPTFDLIFEARPTGKHHQWLTNDVAPAVKRVKTKKPAGVTLHIRKLADLSVLIERGSPIAW